MELRWFAALTEVYGVRAGVRILFHLEVIRRQAERVQDHVTQFLQFTYNSQCIIINLLHCNVCCHIRLASKIRIAWLLDTMPQKEKTICLIPLSFENMTLFAAKS